MGKSSFFLCACVCWGRLDSCFVSTVFCVSSFKLNFFRGRLVDSVFSRTVHEPRYIVLEGSLTSVLILSSYLYVSPFSWASPTKIFLYISLLTHASWTSGPYNNTSLFSHHRWKLYILKSRSLLGSVFRMNSPWRWRRHSPPKRRYLTTSLYGCENQEKRDANLNHRGNIL
jgi:hypothetical protein